MEGATPFPGQPVKYLTRVEPKSDGGFIHYYTIQNEKLWAVKVGSPAYNAVVAAFPNAQKNILNEGGEDVIIVSDDAMQKIMK